MRFLTAQQARRFPTTHVRPAHLGGSVEDMEEPTADGFPKLDIDVQDREESRGWEVPCYAWN